MGVRAALDRLRPQTGAPVMFPWQFTNERATEEFNPQTAYDAMSVAPAGDRPVSMELPVSDRAPQAWVFSTIEPRWGAAIDGNWDGAPLSFYPSKVVDPRVNLGYNPFVMYPTINRGHPVPYGNTVPVLGE